MITRICKYCETAYETWPSKNLLYCSNTCSFADRSSGKTVQCQQCGTDIYQYPSRSRKYCSKSCATTARNLTSENPSYHRDVSGERNPMYGKGMKGSDNPMYGMRKEKSPQWKGGRKHRPDGYISIVVPDDHPNPSYTAESGTKYVLLHRRIMEKHLGRYLSPKEVVHHIDGDPTNNKIENLRLYPNQAAHLGDGHSHNS